MSAYQSASSKLELSYSSAPTLSLILAYALASRMVQWFMSDARRLEADQVENHIIIYQTCCNSETSDYR